VPGHFRSRRLRRRSAEPPPARLPRLTDAYPERIHPSHPRDRTPLCHGSTAVSLIADSGFDLCGEAQTPVRCPFSAAKNWQTADSAAGVRHRWHMKSRRVPSPKDIKAAAQAAAETAQSVASGAMRIPPASIELASQLPDLVENLATATERLNTVIDRAERYIALAEPMLRTMDGLLPQLETLVATGNDVYKAVSSIPGVSTLGRLANRTTDAPARKRPSKSRSR
jgi:hypothetical protein